MMKKLIPSLSALILVTTFSLSAQATLIQDMVVFGDSLSDSGNLFAATGQPPVPYYQGRFSNGPTYAEDLNQYLGLGTLSNSLAGGQNYAWAGARAGYDTPLGGGQYIPGMTTQMNQYMASLAPNSDLNDTLHLVFIGGNDIADAIVQGFDLPTATAFLQNSAQTVINNLLVLNSFSSTQFLLPSVPDLSLTPRFAGNLQAHEYSQIYNDYLSQMLASTSLDYLLFNTSDFILNIADNFEITDVPCLTASGICQNPDNYLFFDDFHPSALAHQMFAEKLLTTVPIPPTGSLMLLFLALGVITRKYHLQLQHQKIR